ncbi:MAG: DUF4956 domain-containing protein [Blastocatellia bacterium]
MNEDFLQLDLFRPSLFEFTANLLVALGCGLAIALLYRVTYRGASYSSSFVNSLVLLCLITSVMILVIGNNLARAFGLVGAMSIIRFRTAVRDVQDIIFIFFALVMGMAAGTGLNAVAIMATIFVGLVFVLLDTTGFSRPVRRQHLLQISHNGAPETETAVRGVLDKYARRIRVTNVRAPGGRKQTETFYQLTLRWRKNPADFVRELRDLESISGVNLLSEEEDKSTPVS